MSFLAGHLWTDPRRPSGPAEARRLLSAADGPGVLAVDIRSAGPLCLAYGHRTADRSRNNNFRGPDMGLHITADVRLDNRGDLAAELGIEPAPDLPDSDLILAAYRKWGRQCCTRLLGDFAFALWDGAEATLFCARDLMGVRPFYYRHEAAAFAFGSRLAALAGPDDPADEGRIAGFLLGFDDDTRDTAIAAVRRLPPGHWIAVRGGEATLSAYAVLSPEPEPRGDVAAAFREKLTQAVAARLAGAAPVGALLSGGLDSSSIVSIAAHLHAGEAGFRMTTYSLGYPEDSPFDESRYVRFMRKAYPLDGISVPLGPTGPLDRLDALTRPGTDLYYAPGAPKIAALLAIAAKATPIVLDGHGGDEVVSHGYGRLVELATAKRWFVLYGELRKVAGTFGDSPATLLRQYVFAYALNGRLRRLLRRVRPTRESPEREQLGTSLLSSDFARRSGAAARQAEWRSVVAAPSANERAAHLYNLTNPAVARAFEALAHIGGISGVELRFPFFDRRLVEFALAVPDDEKLRDGYSRSILRRAMQGLLPPEIQWRRDKIDFSPEFHTALAGPARARLAALRQPGGPLAEYVDLHRLGAAIDDLVAGQPADTMAIWRCMLLADWLERRRAAAACDAAVAEAI